jgi:cytidylate kinase
MIITIDGAAGTGKSTVAKKVAERLGFTYVDTGAMFRAVAYGMLSQRIDIQHVEEFLHNFPLAIKEHQGVLHYYLADIDATDHLRTQEVTDMSSKIATLKPVREALKQSQRAVAQGKNAVFEGRDMGTVVFPKADLKIFLTASPEVQAERRYKEMIQKNPDLQKTLSYEQVLSDIVERDARDRSRAIAPLEPAADARIIDTSHLSIDRVVEKIISYFNSLVG